MGDFADDMIEREFREYADRLYPDRVQTMNLGMLRVHGETECMGPHCVIHNPSGHPLRDAPLYWRSDKGLMERVCTHGVGHDDPDDVAYRRLMGHEASGIHGCCEGNCCSEGSKA